jgi:Tfp pilus assembly protein PilO
VSRRAISGAIGAGALVVVVAAWYFLLYAPRTRAIAHAKSQATAAEAQVSALRGELARLRSEQANLPGLTAELDRLEAAVPASPDLADFILEVNSASTASGVTFLSISPSVPSRPTTTGAAAASAAAPPQITVTLVVEGGYFQVLDFLNRLSMLPRLVVIDGVSISSTASSGAASSGAASSGAASSGAASSAPPSPELRVSVSARIFLAKLPPAAPAAGGSSTGVAGSAAAARSGSTS